LYRSLIDYAQLQWTATSTCFVLAVGTRYGDGSVATFNTWGIITVKILRDLLPTMSMSDGGKPITSTWLREVMTNNAETALILFRFSEILDMVIVYQVQIFQGVVFVLILIQPTQLGLTQVSLSNASMEKNCKTTLLTEPDSLFPHC
jgi:hypothetical protein